MRPCLSADISRSDVVAIDGISIVVVVVVVVVIFCFSWLEPFVRLRLASWLFPVTYCVCVFPFVLSCCASLHARCVVFLLPRLVGWRFAWFPPSLGQGRGDPNPKDRQGHCGTGTFRAAGAGESRERGGGVVQLLRHPNAEDHAGLHQPPVHARLLRQEGVHQRD